LQKKSIAVTIQEVQKQGIPGKQGAFSGTTKNI